MTRPTRPLVGAGLVSTALPFTSGAFGSYGGACACWYTSVAAPLCCHGVPDIATGEVFRLIYLLFTYLYTEPAMLWGRVLVYQVENAYGDVLNSV